MASQKVAFFVEACADPGPVCALQVAAGAALNRKTRRRQQPVITYQSATSQI